MVTRRQMLHSTAAVLTAGLAFPASAKSTSAPRLSVWILRGALDGMAAVAPYADPDYSATRGVLALPGPGANDGLLDLDGFFGLHPALSTLHQWYGAGQLLAVHASATPYRERSHFDGQKLLENGTTSPAATSGWLNRVLQRTTQVHATAVGGGMPLVLRGEAEVAAWSPSAMPQVDDDTLARIVALYGDDVLGRNIEQGLAARNIAGTNSMQGAGRGPGQELNVLAETAARLMRETDGPAVTVLEAGGWDTHANQGALRGTLANRLRQLDTALTRFRNGLGDNWQQAVILVLTEFGRTAAPNGTGGTDHGTASIAMLAGGAVNGGRVIADWPGLASRALLAGRDLQPTLDTRAVCKGVLHDHLGVSRAALDDHIFPGSATVTSLKDLIRPA